MSEKELIAAFEFISQRPTKPIIEKCLEVCSRYGIDAEELTDHWCAFSVTHLKGVDISLEGIILLEQKVLNQQNSSQDTINIKKSQYDNDDKSKNVNGNYERLENMDTSLISDINDDYINQNDSLRTECIADEEMDIKYVKYKDRSGSGTVVATFGNNGYISANTDQIFDIVISGFEWFTEQNYTGLYSSQARIASKFDNHIDYLGPIILRKHNIEILQHEGNLVIYGRIKSDDGKKLNSRTVVLETSRDFNGPKEIVLNISNVKSYSLFPGQIIAAKGITVAKNFIVQEIYSDASPEFISELPHIPQHLRIIVAVGPYTLSENLLYEPLQDLLKQIVQEKPNILILIGPFLDSAHPDVLIMEETFESYFEILVNNIMDCLTGWPIQIILVPSFNDAHHFPCYPTPSYISRNYPNLQYVPNPCLLNINGFIIGINSLDILFQLTKQEISNNVQMDRMGRLAAHILQQRNFFPLYPNRDPAISIDYERLLKDCTVDVKPHLLLLPSVLRYFVKNVDGCLVINPERLAKNHTGGTYAVVNISPISKVKNIIDCISCEIRNI
ncbi:dna polymerase 2 alpha 70 kda subunit [Holotrichia oblita]|uniref:Dna polymerase 2 alpha 70 kDa subunit n=1 Tax=Holotrichia oblita TaxID=644536 RepID=A0ACB9T3H6_HOLOL|nr:dna polymerase 2 alpha 70 kda subunit [Holotrichia oblita]